MTKTKVFSSVKDAWHGILSGSVVPTSTGSRNSTRRRVSCSAIDVPRGNHGRGTLIKTDTQETSAADSAAGSSSKDEVDDILNNIEAYDDLEDSGDDDDYDTFECSVFVATDKGSGPSSSSSNDQEVDLSALSDEDLRRLKRDDPFLYYSIPSIRRGSLLCNTNEDDDNILSNISRPTSASASRRSSMPAEVLAMADMRTTRRRRSSLLNNCPTIEESLTGKIRRDRRHSTECHPTLICEEMMAELEAELMNEMGEGNDSMEEEDEDAMIDDELAALEQELNSLG